jgi:hypothetical protein
MEAKKPYSSIIDSFGRINTCALVFTGEELQKEYAEFTRDRSD